MYSAWIQLYQALPFLRKGPGRSNETLVSARKPDFNGRYKRDINNLIRVLEVRGSVLKCDGMEVQEKALVKSLMQVRAWALTPQQSLQFKDAAGGVLAVFEAVYPKP